MEIYYTLEQDVFSSRSSLTVRRLNAFQSDKKDTSKNVFASHKAEIVNS